MGINIVVVEDEFSILMDITRRLEKMGHHVVGSALSYEEALVAMLEHKPDLMLLDINLEGKKNGIQIAERINENNPIPIIFLTASSDKETFDEALKTKPMGFIVKPFKDEDLRNNIELAINHFSVKKSVPEIEDLNEKSIYVKHNNLLENIPIDSISHLEAMDNYTKIFTSNKKLTVNSPLKNIHAQLPQDKFIRIHKSFVIALSSVKALEGNILTLKSNENIPIGKTYRSEFLTHLKIIE
jgi:DNA-binding LytR/AlgR family response regulator